MLINLREYHRPGDVQEALRLLRRPSPRTVALAGGSRVVGSGDDGVQAVVDLQNLGLRYVRSEGDAGPVHLGAMATLNDLSECDILRSIYSGIIARAAHDSAGSVLRNQRTVGGAVAMACPDDQLLVALLLCDARVTVAASEQTSFPLAEFLARRQELLGAPGLITEITVGPPPAPCAAALTRVARTPADSPIVCAGALLSGQGQCSMGRVALAGVAAAPLRLPAAEALLVGQRLSDAQADAAGRAVVGMVDPLSDFRGSAEYRREMAGVLVARALKQAMDGLR